MTTLTINITVLVIFFAVIVYLTAPWKKVYTSDKKANKNVDPKSSEYFNEREIEAKRIQDELKAKAEGVKERETSLSLESVVKMKTKDN